ncbi:MAG TPA: DUF5330 domain-containing protein [Hyphomicrobiaceae bacterium]|jgi:hypothetical protein|nr:DUF5330 domain-containing protein [Hyphomicrobiaceae bacterium]
MFFIRLAFWLGLVVLVMPTEEHQQARVYNAATAAVERAATFCDRNPKTCATGAQLWAVFLKKAEFGARLAVDLISKSGREAQPAMQPAKSDPTSRRVEHGTLVPADLGPAWRGQVARAGA